jgi:hypothetical protein
MTSRAAVWKSAWWMVHRVAAPSFLFLLYWIILKTKSAKVKG